MFKPIFKLFPALIKKYESLASFQKLPEKIGEANSTPRRLAELKAQIQDFDHQTEKVQDLDLKLERITMREKSLREVVEKRFQNYLSEIRTLEKTKLSPGQKNELTALKLLVKDLYQDLVNYRKGAFDQKFASIYSFLSEKPSLPKAHYFDPPQKLSLKNWQNLPFEMKEVPQPIILNRQEWKASPPKPNAEFLQYPESELKQILNKIVIHHADIKNPRGPKFIQYVQQQMDFSDIAYHFVIDKDGNIFEGRPLSIMGAHAGVVKEVVKANRDIEKNNLLNKTEKKRLKDHFRKSSPDYGGIGIVLDGDFDEQVPPLEQQKALFILLNFLKQKYDIPGQNIVNHREVQEQFIKKSGLNPANSETSCPGDAAHKAFQDLEKYLPPDSPAAQKKIVPARKSRKNFGI
ncbi:MAG TPA: peptidoglycan recognition family protein [Candidatus Gracilibacteria bacterium]|nr:peptidoglycan recognition family protein [Candidatus Gracilibacteria bacterium]